jgi:gas vesicle protein
MSNRSDLFAFLAGLFVGSLIGAALALLLAPQSGQETRAQIKGKGIEFKDRAQEGVVEIGHRTQEQMHAWQEKGKEAFETGKHSAVETISHGKESIVETISQGKESFARTVGHQHKNDLPEQVVS